MRGKVKKQCARPNCDNPKCPFPHNASDGTEEKLTKLPKKKYIPGVSIFYTGNESNVPQIIPVVSPPRKTIPPVQQIGLYNIKEKCRDCRQMFELTVKAQCWFAEKGFQLPKSCRSCRDAKKAGDVDNTEERGQSTDDDGEE